MEMAVLGAGAFGTALAKHLDERGHSVALWCYGADDAAELAVRRESSYLPGARLGPRIAVTHDIAAAVRGRAIVVGVAPSQFTRQVLTEAAPHLEPDAVFACASKGIELGSLETMDRVTRDVLGHERGGRAAFLSGPTFAKELALGLPAAIVVASCDAASAETVQAAFASERLRVYTTDDVIGVEIAGALKNIMAIGAGVSDGLGFGHNTRAALITRGLAEITRLGVRLGANPLTFAGLAGLGDLVLTCTGDLSRNRQVGLELGRGRAIADILAGMHSVAEGVKTTKAARDLAARLGVEAPITEAIYAVIYEGRSAKDAVADLLRREQRPERG